MMSESSKLVAKMALCLMLATAPLFGQAPAGVAEKPVVPLTPAELIKVLPPIPPEWQITSSTASNLFSDWVMTVADRKFKSVVPLQAGTDGAPKPPMLLDIRISDTGGWPGFTAEFRQPSGAKETLQVNGMPAVKFSRNDTHEMLRFLVNNRFVVQITTENQPPNAAEDWAKRLDLSRLTQIKPSGATAVPRPVIISRIDELNPKKNRSYPLHWMTAEEVETESRRDAGESN